MDPRHVISFWLSLIILKTLPTEIKQLYRKYEKNKLKLTTLIAHRLFNETCINIYIYIYDFITSTVAWRFASFDAIGVDI